MRILKTSRMRFKFNRNCVTALLATVVMMLVGAGAMAEIPVYLNTDSRFSSGIHSREWLEVRTKENQLQRWMRVMVGDAYGWLAEDHVLTSLKLTSIAKLIREEPDRSQPQLDSLRGRRIPKGAQFVILEISGSWARGRVLGEDAPNLDSWVLNEALIRDPGNQIERGVTFRTTPLRLSPNTKFKPIDSIPAFSEISILNSIKEKRNGWIEIQSATGTAWIERKNIWLAEDLQDNSVRSLQPGLELRSMPLPNADVVLRLTGTEILKVLNTKYLRWGKVKVPEHGWLWWPISDDPTDRPGLIPPLKISSEDLLQRNIYDMAVSQSIPGLRFASANGVFKSRDGIQWSMIPKFENGNYPISMAKNGTLFIGPYVSADDGETFEQWIRWDRLVEAMKRETGSPPSRLRISGIETLDKVGQLVELKMDVGRTKAVRMETPDRGFSWKVR